MLVKGQSRLDVRMFDVRKYYFSQTTVIEWYKLSSDCVCILAVLIFLIRM